MFIFVVMSLKTKEVASINALTEIIVDEIFQTYFMYGPGLYERIYEATLAGRLRSRGLKVERQKQIFISNEFVENEPAFFADLIVEELVIIELKSVAKLEKVMFKQVRSYLKLLDLRVGFLVNFNSSFLKKDIHRVTNQYDEELHGL